MYEEVKDRAEKGYARMVTNYGALNFEVREVASMLFTLPWVQSAAGH